MSVNKQVKSVMSNYPYYLGNCLIVKKSKFTTKLGHEFEIHRAEIVVNDVVRYLDLITTIYHCFKGLGGFYGDIRSSHHIAEIMCDSLAVLDYLEDSLVVTGYLE